MLRVVRKERDWRLQLAPRVSEGWTNGDTGGGIALELRIPAIANVLFVIS